MSIPRGVRGTQRVQRDYGGVTKQLRANRPLAFEISETVIPVYDIGGINGVDQITISQTVIITATGTVTTDTQSPVGLDYNYVVMNISLSVARAVQVAILPPGGFPNPAYCYNSNLLATPAQVLHVLCPGNAPMPIRVPSLASLRVIVLGMLVGDGNGTINFMRYERFRDG